MCGWAASAICCRIPTPILTKENNGGRSMTRDQVRSRIEEIGIIPAIRVSSAQDALFVAEAVSSAGIPIVELTMTVPGAIDAISQLARNNPVTIVAAGTVLHTHTPPRHVHRCPISLTITRL